MPTLLLAAIAPIGRVLLQMLLALVTEKFIKQAVIMGLEKLVKLTETEEDDKLLKAAEEVWNKKPEVISTPAE